MDALFYVSEHLPVPGLVAIGFILFLLAIAPTWSSTIDFLPLPVRLLLFWKPSPTSQYV